jgi:hypothetical protein
MTKLTYDNIKMSDFIQVSQALNTNDVDIKFITLGKVFLGLSESEVLNMDILLLSDKLKVYFDLFLQPLEQKRELAGYIILNGIKFKINKDFGDLEFGRFIQITKILEQQERLETHDLRFKILKAILKPVGMKYSEAVASEAVQAAINDISVQDCYDAVNFFLFGTQAFKPVILAYLQKQLKAITPRKRGLTKIMAGFRSYSSS